MSSGCRLDPRSLARPRDLDQLLVQAQCGDDRRMSLDRYLSTPAVPAREDARADTPSNWFVPAVHVHVRLRRTPPRSRRGKQWSGQVLIEACFRCRERGVQSSRTPPDQKSRRGPPHRSDPRHRHSLRACMALAPPTIKAVRAIDDRLIFELDQDREVSLPISASARLARATAVERDHWTIGPRGTPCTGPMLTRTLRSGTSSGSRRMPTCGPSVRRPSAEQPRVGVDRRLAAEGIGSWPVALAYARPTDDDDPRGAGLHRALLRPRFTDGLCPTWRWLRLVSPRSDEPLRDPCPRTVRVRGAGPARRPGSDRRACRRAVSPTDSIVNARVPGAGGQAAPSREAGRSRPS